MDAMHERIADFLAGDVFAVAGASNDRAKFGNRVLRHYRAAGRTAHAVHPKELTVEGQRAYVDLAALPERVHGLSIITPPAVTEVLVRDAIDAGIERIWMQPGAESQAAIEAAEAAGIVVIAGGPCVLIELTP